MMKINMNLMMKKFYDCYDYEIHMVIIMEFGKVNIVLKMIFGNNQI